MGIALTDPRGRIASLNKHYDTEIKKQAPPLRHRVDGVHAKIQQQLLRPRGIQPHANGIVRRLNFQIDFLIGYSSLPVTQTEMGVFYTFAAQTAFRDGGDIGVPPGGFGDHP